MFYMLSLFFAKNTNNVMKEVKSMKFNKIAWGMNALVAIMLMVVFRRERDYQGLMLQVLRFLGSIVLVVVE